MLIPLINDNYGSDIKIINELKGSPIDNYDALDYLDSKNLKLDNYINKSNIQKFLDDKKFINKEDLDGKKIWMLVNLENWLRSKNL